MRIDWKNLKKFIDDTELYHYVNYLDLVDSRFVWLSYQIQNFECLLQIGSQDYAEFDTDYKPRTILKDNISNDGRTFSRITHVKDGRYLHVYYVVFSTSSKETNDTSGFFSVELFDDKGDPTDVGANAVKTCVDFEPNFTVEMYGGGLETLEDMTEIFYASAIINPDIEENIGGNFVKIRNKRLLRPKENVFKSGFGTVELPYTEGSHTNVLRAEIIHVKGIEQPFQYEVQFYK